MTREETMKIWITGGAGSGKSSLAQELASALAAGGPHYYVATMVPRDDEDRRRISRHIEDRAGMGFGTIECPCRLTERITPDSEGTYLLDSASRYGIWDNRVPMPPHGAHHA